MKKINTYSERAMCYVAPVVVHPFIWIQIKTSNTDIFLSQNKSKNCVAKLNLSFYDTSNPNEERCFNLNQANKVLEFIEEYSDIDLLIINCEDGLSKSSGMAIGLEESVLKIDSSSFRDTKPLFNVHVSNLIKRAYSSKYKP